MNANLRIPRTFYYEILIINWNLLISKGGSNIEVVNYGRSPSYLDYPPSFEKLTFGIIIHAPNLRLISVDNAPVIHSHRTLRRVIPQIHRLNTIGANVFENIPRSQIRVYIMRI